MFIALTASRSAQHAGSLLLSSSSVLIFLSLSSQPAFPLMVLLFALFGHSMSFCDNAGIATSVKNFSQHKGSAVGLMKAMEGLTAAVVNTARKLREARSKSMLLDKLYITTYMQLHTM